jgi:hypothetical protein
MLLFYSGYRIVLDGSVMIVPLAHRSGATTAILSDGVRDTSGPVSEAISQSGNYGFVNRNKTSDGTGIPGGVGGGTGYQSPTIFYVGVPDVEAVLKKESRRKALDGPRKETWWRPGCWPFHRSRRQLDRLRRTEVVRGTHRRASFAARLW